MTASSDNVALFDLAAIRQQIGDKVFERGEAYFEDDAVALSKIDRSEVRASVAGTETYRVALALGGGRPVRQLAGDCTCPARIDFGLCKHMVATAFAANAATEGADVPELEQELPGGLDKWLASQPKTKLVALVLELAESDDRIGRKLQLKASASSSAGNIATAAAAIMRALNELGRMARSSIDDRNMSGWAQEFMDVLDAIEAIIAPGCSGHVKPLIDQVYRHAGTALDNGYDPERSLVDVFERADDLTLKMRLADRPEPVGLARELFGELMDQGGYRHVPLDAYWSLLGHEGLEELKRLARELWSNTRRKRRGGVFVQDDGQLRRPLFQLLDQIAEREGDLAARIALRREDARSTFDQVRLAEFLIGEGRSEEALAVAEEAHFEFADTPDDRLTSLLANLYGTSGFPAKAEELLWARFTARPDMTSFQMLVDPQTGEARAAIEERAIQFLQDRRMKPQNDGSSLPSAAYGNSTGLLLDILTSSGRYAAAWMFARTERLPEERLKQLALASAEAHAREALPVLRTLVERILRSGIAGRYDEPLRCIELIMKHTQDDARSEARRWLAALRRDHARKRNLLAGLDRRRLR